MARSKKASERRRITRHELRKKLYNMTDVCRALNVNYVDFRDRVLEGQLPQGSSSYGNKCYYTESDLQKIKDMITIV